MRIIFKRLVEELGEALGKEYFEWYCSTYGVTISDDAPEAVKHEVLGV